MVLASFVMTGSAQRQDKTTTSSNRVVLITLDGYRWQELFAGADSFLVRDSKYVTDTSALIKKFWRATPQQRREALMPFVWDFVQGNGIMLGNRYKGQQMRVANGMHFSYPGYNEDLCGIPDDKNIHSNDKIYNPNVSVLEAANNSPIYKNSVLAFGSWDVFPYILNEKRSKLEVNAGYRSSLSPKPTKLEKAMDIIQQEEPRHWKGVRWDTYTFHYALEAMKTRHPKMVYIAFGETDDFAHEGLYDEYLASAHRTDEFIRQLWEYVQSDPFYKGQTTFIITCDHGRGRVEDNKDYWRSHGTQIPHSEETWLIAFGNKIKKEGVVKNGPVYYNKQVAPTVARLLNLDFLRDSKPLDIFYY